MIVSEVADLIYLALLLLASYLPPGLAYPLAALLVISIILRSTWVTLCQRGIVWRGTSYPLEELKRGIV